MTGGLSCRSAAATHVGAVRKHNQDRFVARPELGLWAVADGAGGLSHGERASAAVTEALEAIPAGLPPARLLAEVRLRINDAHETLRAEAARGGAGATMASTVVVLIARGEHYACLWAGDSRAYLLRGGVMEQMTRDHSLVQEMVDAGEITADQAERHPQANVITRAVGADADLALDKVSDRLQPGDLFLLCSDGLCKTLAEGEIAALLAAEGAAAADRLIEASLARQVRDNVTTVAVQVLGDDMRRVAQGGQEAAGVTQLLCSKGMVSSSSL